MTTNNVSPHRRRIGFVSTRLAGTDGVSLETAKWVTVLERLGHECVSADQNYRLAKQYYSYAVLERRPRTLMADGFGEETAYAED